MRNGFCARPSDASIRAMWSITTGTGERFNFIQVENPELDKHMAAAEVERDRTKAKALWSETQKEIVDEAYYTFLYQQNDIHAIDKRVQGADMNAYGWGYNLEEWYVPKDRQKYPQAQVGASPWADSAAARQAQTASAAGSR